MRCLGIDYGERRVGLAWGDELGVAVPLPAATEADPQARLARIEKLIHERRATDLVVGYPYNMDGSAGFKAREVDTFIAVLEQRFGLPVHRVDERLTSHKVEGDLGLTARRERELRKRGVVDSGAAAVILQDWLDLTLPQADPLEPDWEED